MKKLIILLLPLLVISCDNTSKEENIDESIELVDTLTSKPVSPDFIYGFSKDSFLFTPSTINRNEFLSGILSQYGVDYATIDRIAKASKDVYDVRKLRHGRSYCVVSSKDSSAKCFIYEPNDIEYVVYDFTKPDSINIYKKEKPVLIEEKKVSGVITSSLYESMQDIEVSPVLALKLSEIYAWAIDFYRIQKFDRFKVIFNENYVDGKSVGIGQVKAAVFYHFNEPYYAFYFEEGEVPDYYDEEGNSLRKAFLKTPVKFSTLTSRYNRTRFHPVLKRVKPHLGTDYAAPHGTPIRTTGDGVVIKASYTSGNGNYVKVRHNSTYTTQYLHMSKFAKGIKNGSRVRQGDIIGYVGATGLATGPHVCYRFWKNGSQVDPLREKIPPSKPVAENNRNKYNELKSDWMTKLENINWPESWNEEMAKN